MRGSFRCIADHRIPGLSSRVHVPSGRPRLRQLRRHRIGARVLRAGRVDARRRSRSWTPRGSSASHWFDTADAYGGGRSETWIGEWLAGDRQPCRQITIARRSTRWTTGDDRGLARGAGAAPGRVEPRAARHRPHRPVPGARARPATRRSTRRSARSTSSSQRGLVEALGRQQLRRGASCAQCARARGTPARCVQNSYSLLDRADEETVFPLCAEHGTRLPGVRAARRRLAGRASTGATRRCPRARA